MQFKSLIFILISVCLLFGCRNIDTADSMSFYEVTYCTKFPKSQTLTGGEKLDLDLIGISSFRIIDTLLIVSTLDKDGCWSFFKLSDYSYLGNYLKKGRGSNEVLDCPRVGKQYFYKDSGNLYSIIYDFYTGDVVRMNVTETLLSKKTVIQKEQKFMERNLFNVAVLDSTTYFCRAVNKEHTALSRYVFYNGEKYVPDSFATLNESSVCRGGDVNLLGTYIGYNQVKKILAEAGMGLSVINLYSIDDKYKAKTICPEKKLLKISEQEYKERRDKWSAFCHLAVYDDYFAVLYQGDTAENIYEKKAISQKIQFFDWDGKPLAELDLNRRINSFDIDFSAQTLYTLNYEEDEIYKYDLSVFLAEVE